MAAKEEEITVPMGSTERNTLGHLFLSVSNWTPNSAQLVVGRPGLPNVEKRVNLGGALLFETPDEGLLDVRLMSVSALYADLLITQVSPRAGIAGGLLDDRDPANTAFTPAEIGQITDSLNEIRHEMGLRNDLMAEQLDLINRKLDDMEVAAHRMGKKDWMAYAVGTLTSMIVNAAIDTNVGKALFEVADVALSWLFDGALKMIS